METESPLNLFIQFEDICARLIIKVEYSAYLHISMYPHFKSNHQYALFNNDYFQYKKNSLLNYFCHL